jgi:hypothetical protein
MARTIIEDQSSSPTYVEDSSGPALGLIVGLLLAVAVIVLAVLFFRGTWDNNSNSPSVPGTGNGGGASAPAQPNDQQQPSTAP